LDALIGVTPVKVLKAIGKVIAWPFRTTRNACRALFKEFGPRKYFKSLEQKWRPTIKRLTARTTASGSPPPAAPVAAPADYDQIVLALLKSGSADIQDIPQLMRQLIDETRRTRQLIEAQHNDLQRIFEQNEQWVLTCLKTQQRESAELASVAVQLQEMISGLQPEVPASRRIDENHMVRAA
jgi:hypothetical protein